MKKTRGTLVLLLILAIFALAIGYAAMGANLKINGTLSAAVDDENFKVKFVKETDVTPSYRDLDYQSTTVTPTVSTDVTNDLLATFSVAGFTSVGDSVVLEYTVQNESEDIDATVTAADLTTFGNSEYFEVISSFETNAVTKTKEITAGNSATLYVTVSCIKTPTAAVTAQETEGIVTLTAVPAT